MAIMTRLLSCTLLALFALNGQVLADQQQQQPAIAIAIAPAMEAIQQFYAAHASNSNYGNDKKPDGPMNGSGWQPSNDTKPGDGKNMSAADWPGPPMDGGDKPDGQPGQGPPHAPPSNPPPGHPDQWHHGDGKYGKTQVLWGQCGGYYYSGTTQCPDGAYCRYFSDWYSQCNPKDHHN